MTGSDWGCRYAIVYILDFIRLEVYFLISQVIILYPSVTCLASGLKRQGRTVT